MLSTLPKIYLQERHSSLLGKAAVVAHNMINKDMSFTQAVDDALGFAGGNPYTNPPIGFGDESNETGVIGPGFKEGGSTSLKDSLQIDTPKELPITHQVLM